MIAALAEWSTVIALLEQTEGKKQKTGHGKWPAIDRALLVGRQIQFP